MSEEILGPDEDRELMDELNRLVERQRLYASFREIGPKEWKEVDVVRDLMQSLGSAGGDTYANIRAAPEDPPDCLATDDRGQSVAIEVTELVSEDAVD